MIADTAAMCGDRRDAAVVDAAGQVASLFSTTWSYPQSCDRKFLSVVPSP